MASANNPRDLGYHSDGSCGFLMRLVTRPRAHHGLRLLVVVKTISGESVDDMKRHTTTSRPRRLIKVTFDCYSDLQPRPAELAISKWAVVWTMRDHDHILLEY